jgi:hypothetical protein
MENINAYFVSKITFIRYLLVILISSISIGVLAEAQNPKSIDGSWVNSGGRDHESAQNPRYTFEVTQAGEFDIRLESATANPCIDTVLYLLETNSLKDSNDDWTTTRVPQSPHSDCNYNSRIITSNLSNGIYTLVAGTYYEGESDNFVISVRSAGGSFNLEKSDSEETKSISSDCSGEWKSSGGKNYKSNRNPNFDLIVTAKEKVTINLTSSVDTYLYLLSNDGLKAENDDIGNGNYNSRILEELTPGSYKLVAATWGNNQTGDFDLIVTSTDGNSELKCSPGGEDEGGGGNSSQQPLSLGEDVTITWNAIREERVYQSEATGGSGNPVYMSLNPTDFPVDSYTGVVEYKKTGSVTIKAVQSVNDTQHTAEYTLTVEKADQATLVVEDITKTFSPSLEFTPIVSGGSTEEPITFYYVPGDTDVVSFIKNSTALKIKSAGTVVIRATRAGDMRYNPVSNDFVLTVNKAQPWIKIGKLNQGKVIANVSDGALNIEVNVGIGQGQDEKTIEVNKDDFEFDYTNNTQPLFSPVKIQNSKIFAKKIGRASIEVSVPESANYFAAQKEFVLEVRPQKVEFDQNNLSNKSITKQCGEESVDIDLMIDDNPLAHAPQNTGSSDDILVFDSSDTSVAQVNSQTGEVILVGKGKTTISATLFGDSKLKDSYDINVNSKGKRKHWIEFEETGLISIYGDDISNKSVKNQIKDWDNGVITYSIEQEKPFLIVDESGEVTLDPKKHFSDLPSYFTSTIVATKAGNSCYESTYDSYKIEFYKSSAFHFPKQGESVDKEYTIKWSFPDSELDNKIQLSYVYSRYIIQNFDDFEEKLIAEVDISAGFYKWNTSGLDEGNYYIIARTSEGRNANILDCDIKGTNGCFLAKNPLRIAHPKIIEVKGSQLESDNNRVKVSLNYDVKANYANAKGQVHLRLYLGYDDRKLTFKGIHKDTLGFPSGNGDPITKFSQLTDAPSSKSSLLNITDYKAGKEGQIKFYDDFKKVTTATRAVDINWLELDNDNFLDGKDEDTNSINLLSALFERKGGFTSGSTEVDIIQKISSGPDFFKIENIKIEADPTASSAIDTGK